MRLLVPPPTPARSLRVKNPEADKRIPARRANVVSVHASEIAKVFVKRIEQLERVIDTVLYTVYYSSRAFVSRVLWKLPHLEGDEMWVAVYACEKHERIIRVRRTTTADSEISSQLSSLD